MWVPHGAGHVWFGHRKRAAPDVLKDSVIAVTEVRHTVAISPPFGPKPGDLAVECPQPLTCLFSCSPTGRDAAPPSRDTEARATTSIQGAAAPTPFKPNMLVGGLRASSYEGAAVIKWQRNGNPVAYLCRAMQISVGFGLIAGRRKGSHGGIHLGQRGERRIMTSSARSRRPLAPGLAARPLAVGCWAIGGPAVHNGVSVGWSTSSDDAALEGLRTAASLGSTLFDTADAFGLGHSERLLGQLVAEVGRRSVLLSSKAGWVKGTAPHPYAGPALRHQFEQTLENLDTDFVDLYSLHNLDFGHGDEYLHVANDQLRAFREAGCIRAIGMPGPPVGHATSKGIAEHPGHTRFVQIFRLLRPDVIWASCNPLAPPPHVAGEPLGAFAARHGVSLMLTEPLAQGLITGKYTPRQRPRFELGDHRRDSPLFSLPVLAVIDEELTALRERFGPTPDDLTRVALRFALQQGDHTVVAAGFSTPRQVELNLAPAPLLTSEEMSFVAGVYGQIRRRLSSAVRSTGRLLHWSGAMAGTSQRHGVNHIPSVGSALAP